MLLSDCLRRGVLLLLFLLTTSTVHAAGFGLFINGGNVDADWDGDALNIESKGSHLDYGFALDSNLATDRLFNYRLELGRAEWQLDNFNGQNVEANIDGMVMNHDFGFGGLITDNVRLWFGPELRFMLLEGDLENVPSARDIDLFGFGVGAAIGLNVNLPGRLTIAAKGGFIMMDYIGHGPNWNEISSNWQSSSYDIEEDLIYVGVTMFFRTKS